MTPERIKELETQLAASQAREAKLREALGRIKTEFEQRLTATFDAAMVVTIADPALSLPSDTTALRLMMERAAEVSLERCRWSIEPYRKLEATSIVNSLLGEKG